MRNKLLLPGNELLEKRPVGSNDNNEEEELSTITCKDIGKETETGPAKSKPEIHVPTPEQSLISDFQIVTDLQVSAFDKLSWCSISFSLTN